MATEGSPQRAYRAACPQCGAPVEFRSPASPFAVCSYCRSTVVREGDALRRIGQSAELFDDHSPLQIGTAGRYQGAAFTLVGRLQFGYDGGTWNEWHALFDAGGADAGTPRSAWLSEDNGRHVMAVDAPLAGPAPAVDELRPGASIALDGRAWSVASVTRARLVAAQGELPVAPAATGEFTVCDLRNPQGEVGTLDYAEPQRPRWSIGRSVALSELRLTGLAEGSEKTLAGRGLACPNCGAALTVKLETTQSIVCPQCRSVVDLSEGVAGELRHYAQARRRDPQIPLGATGTLSLDGPAVPWQVVGYVERSEVAESADDEPSSWREYLLYHRGTGFAFLVDASDGWSWSVPLTGAPEGFGESVRWQGVLYRKLYDYRGRITYVLGEFYWRLARDELTANTDYQGTGSASARRLNRETTEGRGIGEVVWSTGATIDAAQVASAFRLGAGAPAALARDAAPVSANAAGWLAKLFLWGFIIVVIIVLFRCTGSDDCDDTRATFGAASNEYQNCLAGRGGGVGGLRTGGGAFGGYSSGGSHK